MNEKVLARCGLSGSVTPMWTTEQVIEAYSDAGFGGIGIWLYKFERGCVDGFWIPEITIPQDVVETTAHAVRASGLKVSHLVLSGFYTEPNREGRIEHTLHAMDLAAALDAECLVIAPGRRNGRSYVETQNLAARAITKFSIARPKRTFDSPWNRSSPGKATISTPWERLWTGRACRSSEPWCVSGHFSPVAHRDNARGCRAGRLAHFWGAPQRRRER